MKLKIETVDMPEERFRQFAEFLGWTPTVMTEDLSPNVPVGNPQTFLDFFEARYGEPIREDVARFRAAQAEAEAKAAREAADAALAANLEAQRAAAGQIVGFDVVQ